MQAADSAPGGEDEKGPWMRTEEFGVGPLIVGQTQSSAHGVESRLHELRLSQAKGQSMSPFLGLLGVLLPPAQTVLLIRGNTHP